MSRASAYGQPVGNLYAGPPKPGIVSQVFKQIPAVRVAPNGFDGVVVDEMVCPHVAWSRDWFKMPADVDGKCALCGDARTIKVEVSMTYRAATPQELTLETASRPRKASKRPALRPVPAVASLDLVGPAEIAVRLNVKPQTVALWKFRGRMPRPIAIVSNVPVWHWETIEAWHQGREKVSRAS